MKKSIAKHSFAVLSAALMMIGTAACSSAPIQEDQPVAEVPASAPQEETVSSTTTSVDSSLSNDLKNETSAPVVNDTVSNSTSAPSSLGASSSGRGH